MGSEFLIENIEWVLTLVFMAGGGWFMLRNLSTKIDSQTDAIEKRFDSLDSKDAAHDVSININERAIANNDKRITVNETRIDANKSMMADALKKLDAIYKMLVSGSNK